MSLVTILGTDVVRDSRAVINSNFTHLEDTKVTGPASATDNAVARFDTTTGKLVQNSRVTIGDNGNIVTTVPDAANVAGLTINQNDVTNAVPGIEINSDYGRHVNLISTDWSFHPRVLFYLNAIGFAESAQWVGETLYLHKDTDNNDTAFARTVASARDSTDGSEVGSFDIYTKGASTLPTLRLRAGEDGRFNEVNGISVGSGSNAGILQSYWDQDLILQTGNATTGSITIVDGADGDITVAPNGTGAVVADTNTLRVTTAKTPASATAAGTTGDIAWDADYIYVCVATDTWKRSAISTW